MKETFVIRLLGSKFIVKYKVIYKVVYDKTNKIFVWTIFNAILLEDVMQRKYIFSVETLC